MHEKIRRPLIGQLPKASLWALRGERFGIGITQYAPIENQVNIFGEAPIAAKALERLVPP